MQKSTNKKLRSLNKHQRTAYKIPVLANVCEDIKTHSHLNTEETCTYWLFNEWSQFSKTYTYNVFEILSQSCFLAIPEPYDPAIYQKFLKGWENQGVTINSKYLGIYNKEDLDLFFHNHEIIIDLNFSDDKNTTQFIMPYTPFFLLTKK